MLDTINKGFMLLETASQIVVPDADGNIVPYTAPVPTGPSVLVMTLCALLAIVCVALVVIILLQKKRASGIGAALSGSGDTYWSKNKGKSVEGSLERITKLSGAALLIIALLLNILIK